MPFEKLFNNHFIMSLKKKIFRKNQFLPMNEDFDSYSSFHLSVRNEPTEEDKAFFGELIGDSATGGAELVSCW
jgi:hypothetical protein